MFKNISGGYEDLWKAIIRPPRDEYQISDLGHKLFKINNIKVQRTDLELVNKRGLKLQCSHFEPVDSPFEQHPCVVYLHGNSSSRLESMNCLSVLIPQYVTVFSFDFAGCGRSEGEYISLGWYERDDVDAVVTYLRNSNKVSTIGLWGRSMGAVTALMHADRDPSIAGLVLDGPFSSLRQLAEELCAKYSNIPKFVMSAALAIIKSTIKDKAKFDINDLNPLKNHVKSAFIPALFMLAENDDFIIPKHTQDLYEAYAGDKNIIKIDGDHNSKRPKYALDSIGIFFHNTLQVEYLCPLSKIDEYASQKEKQNKVIDKIDQDFKLKHPQINEIQAPQKKIGNLDQVQNALLFDKNQQNNKDPQKQEVELQEIPKFVLEKDYFFESQDPYDEDEEIKKAIEESLKMQSQPNNQQISNNKNNELKQQQQIVNQVPLQDKRINHQQVKAPQQPQIYDEYFQKEGDDEIEDDDDQFQLVQFDDLKIDQISQNNNNLSNQNPIQNIQNIQSKDNKDQTQNLKNGQPNYQDQDLI